MHPMWQAVRQSVTDGLCAHCLLQQVLQPQPPPDPAFLPDTSQRWIGPYVLLGEIARGGMGIVFRARERDLGREVALKLLRGAEWVSGDALERFRTEARAAAALLHPHIVPVYAFGDDGGNWYIAMRLIEGGSLADWIQRETADGSRPTDPRKAATILRKLAFLLACSVVVITVGSWAVSRNLRAVAEGQRRSIVALNTESANQRIAEGNTAASLPYHVQSLRLDATQTFLVVTGDGVLHRWHCVPTPESTDELSRLSDALNGVPPTR